jgi:hypothetical protein
MVAERLEPSYGGEPLGGLRFPQPFNCEARRDADGRTQSVGSQPLALQASGLDTVGWSDPGGAERGISGDERGDPRRRLLSCAGGR